MSAGPRAFTDDRTTRSRTAASGRREDEIMSARKATRRSALAIKGARAKARKTTKKDDSPVVKVTPIDQRDFPVEPRKARKSAAEKAASKEKAPREDLCVFAFRLTEEERDAIHRAAGPAKASKYARTLLIAAARNDEAAVKAIMKAAKGEA